MKRFLLCAIGLVQCLGCDFVPTLTPGDMEVASVSSKTGCVSQCLTGEGLRRVLKFEVKIENKGNSACVAGDLPQCDPATKRLVKKDAFTYDKCRDAWSIRQFSTATIMKQDGTVIATSKVPALCMMDTQCDNQDRETSFSCKKQGLSVGCTDRSERNLPCQWIDITDLPEALLKEEIIFQLTVNGDNEIAEENKANNTVRHNIVLSALQQDVTGTNSTPIAVCKKP